MSEQSLTNITAVAASIIIGSVSTYICYRRIHGFLSSLQKIGNFTSSNCKN